MAKRDILIRNDPCGNPSHLTADRGYYDQSGNVLYDTATPLRDTVVVGNRVHDVKQWFSNGGEIYHLSADPGALIAKNYNMQDGIAMYLNEGLRYVTLRDNAIGNVIVWLNLSIPSPTRRTSHCGRQLARFRPSHRDMDAVCEQP